MSPTALTEIIAASCAVAFLTTGACLSHKILMVAADRHASQITLLSETDPLGRITFANDAFCRISKYSQNELLGQPHNIIRHPDMPRELFEKLWQTILKGEVFKCVLKNRAQDGSHYWVNATIMALLDRDRKITKCIGVRHLIPDETTARRLFDDQASAMRGRR